MDNPIVLPAAPGPQTEAWHALFDLYERHPGNWALIGGQMVHLHCIERGSDVVRPTDDADAVLDVRAEPELLERFTTSLVALGFGPSTTGDGLQHRWTKGEAQIDVLLPDGIGEIAAARKGIDGAPTLPAPGTTQALHRTELVTVSIGGRTGTVPRPNLVGALVGKAAARTKIVNDQHGRSRHCEDFVILCGLITGRDFRPSNMGSNPLTSKQRSMLRKMVQICLTDDRAQGIAGWEKNLTDLERAAAL